MLKNQNCRKISLLHKNHLPINVGSNWVWIMKKTVLTILWNCFLNGRKTLEKLQKTAVSSALLSLEVDSSWFKEPTHLVRLPVPSPKSNPNFPDITWNVEILHEIFCVVSHFPRYISYYFAENRFPLWQRMARLDQGRVVAQTGEPSCEPAVTGSNAKYLKSTSSLHK